VRTPATIENLEMLRRIESENAVCIHVRRGDYISNPETERVHGACSIDYYRSALVALRERTDHPRFFVFSDDPGWARAEFGSEGSITVVEINGADRNYEDLRLMSSCRHHVIANSTFSWWGAWLGAHAGQVVVAPKTWFASGDRDSRDICPASWLRV